MAFHEIHMPAPTITPIDTFRRLMSRSAPDVVAEIDRLVAAYRRGQELTPTEFAWLRSAHPSAFELFRRMKDEQQA
jgi:hypothetical protein